MLCCARVWRGSLDYELSGEQEAQQWGGSPHAAALRHQAEATEEALVHALKRAIETPQMRFARTSSPGVCTHKEKFCKKKKECFMRSEGVHAEARNTHTHTLIRGLRRAKGHTVTLTV